MVPPSSMRVELSSSIVVVNCLGCGLVLGLLGFITTVDKYADCRCQYCVGEVVPIKNRPGFVLVSVINKSMNVVRRHVVSVLSSSFVRHRSSG